jgi:hypothetical protein
MAKQGSKKPMTVDDYRDKLDAVGWLRYLSRKQYPEIRKELARHLARGVKQGVYGLQVHLPGR